jgi:DNA-binding beta-propeller fold protein YncE
MKMRLGFKTCFVTAASLVMLAACSQEAAQMVTEEPVAAAPAPAVADWSNGPPEYRVDIDWPKPLPNNWLVQSVTGMYVDDDDNIWVLNRPESISGDETNAEADPPISECCVRPPAVMKFDQEGNLLTSWGTEDYVEGWPAGAHTIFTDRDGNVWIGGSQAGDTLLKFTPDGQLISDFGHRGARFDGPAREQPQDNQQTDLLLRGTASADLDEDAREIYVADGYLNKRVMVFDLDTGEFKRGWGAYGAALAEIPNEPYQIREPDTAPLPYFSTVHCVQISNDGLVYVCDRVGNRVQVFTKEGEYLKEFIVRPETLGRGTAGMVSFSPDPEQRFLFLSDIQNGVVWILNRETGEVEGRFGRRGYNAGQLMLMHLAVSDSDGNVYTGEVAAAGRVQKFSPVWD